MSIQKDGYKTTIGFSSSASGIIFNVIAKEKGVTPPAIEGGGKIDITTMRNDTVRTFYPKQLYTMGDCSVVVAYDPDLYDEMVSVIGVNQTITITFPDGETLAFWGTLDSFAPNENVEGEQPTAVLTIIATNLDDSNVETEPTFPGA